MMVAYEATIVLTYALGTYTGRARMSVTLGEIVKLAEGLRQIHGSAAAEHAERLSLVATADGDNESGLMWLKVAAAIRESERVGS